METESMEILRIAICDDEQIARELLEKYIQDWSNRRDYPIKISSFSGGKELLLALDQNNYDLALLDIQMQAPDGCRGSIE